MDMNAYTALYPDMIVHRAGCADIAKVANRHADTTVTAEAESVEAFLDKELVADLASLGYGRDDFDVKPCAREARS